MLHVSSLLEPIVRLRLAIEQTRDPQLRAELREIEVSLRRQLGPSVPKRAAARLLGVSVTALDRWVDRGQLPAVSASPAATRLGIETGPLLDLATQVRRLRRAGSSHAVLSQAIRELGWQHRGQRLVYGADIAKLPRPNVPLGELERQFEETTPAERVLQQDALHRSVVALSKAAR